MTAPSAIAVSTVAAAPAIGPALFSLDALRLNYEPFPIGFAEEALDPQWYAELLRNWPPHELFLYKPALGHKFSLSEVNHPEQYRRFIEGSPPWKRLHALLKSPAFIDYVLESLKDHNIDVGYAAEQLNARFEFSMLGGDGGNIKPHTDAPNKIITLVINFVEPGAWNHAWGGGTAVLKPKDVALTYNHLNLQLDFSEVEKLSEFRFDPNSCVLFIKTFNSYHAVYPIRAPHHVIRRSLTINIEDLHDPRLKYLKHYRGQFRRRG